MIIKKDIYNGDILQDRFAYDYFKKDVRREGNIISFVAPMRVEAEFMVDKEDLVSKDYIYSELAVNFLIEIPDISLYAGVCFQRLFNSRMADIMSYSMGRQEKFRMSGDDILLDCAEKKKASVSIAKWVNGAVLIHTGININAGAEAPGFAYSTNYSHNEVVKFMCYGESVFDQMSRDIFLATTKIIK